MLEKSLPSLSQIQAERKRREQSDIVKWAESNFYIKETSQPIKFYPHQAAVLRYAFKRDEKGNFRFQTVIYSTPKKSGKTTVAGAVVRWSAETWGKYNEIYCIGNDLEQAKERSFKAVKTSIELDPLFDRQHNLLPDKWSLAAESMTCRATGSKIKAIAADYRGEAGSNPALSVWCVSQDTEMLTKDGWKTLLNLTMADEIATLNISTGYMEWQKPNYINRTHYTGSMVRFKHRRAEFLVTPQHRVLGQFTTHSRYNKNVRAGKWEYKEAQDLAHDKYAAGWLKADAKWQGVDSGISEDEASLLGYYISEGCISWSKRKGIPCAKSIIIAQDKIANLPTYNKIKGLLDRLELSYRAYKSGFFIPNEKLAQEFYPLGVSNQKYIPSLLKNSPENILRAFFLAYLEGDGWLAGKDGYQCTTTSQKLADDLMEIGMKLGFNPRLMSSKRRKSNHNIAYRLSFSQHPIYWQRYDQHWSFEDYDGVVGCPSVPNKNFYMRYRGKAIWTGNTELWGYIHEDAVRFWAEMAPSPIVKNSMRMIETYAGFEGESELLWGLYQSGVLEGRQLTAGEIGLDAFEESPNPDDKVPCYVNEAAGIFAYWDDGDQAHRMPWQRGEEGKRYYASESATQKPNQMSRLHGNKWVRAESSFVPIEWWDACLNPLPLKVGEKTPLVIGLDAAVSGDCFALVVVSRDPLNPKLGIAVRACRVWTPPKGGKIDFVGPEEAVKEFCKLYNVIECCYDPYQLYDMGTRLTKAGICWMNSFDQGNKRLEADKGLYDLILQKRIRHDGNPDLREHIANANAKQSTDTDSKMRIVKKAESRKIDLLVSLSMCSFECLRLNI